MEQLINNNEIVKIIDSNETKIREYCLDELEVLKHTYLLNKQRIIKESGINGIKIGKCCLNELKILKNIYLLDKQRIITENDLDFNDMKQNINKLCNTLRDGYDQYLKDNSKNTIVIDNGVRKYYPLNKWIENNSYEMDVINVFLKELPISYDLSLSPHDKIGAHERDAKLVITLTKLD